MFWRTAVLGHHCYEPLQSGANASVAIHHQSHRVSHFFRESWISLFSGTTLVSISVLTFVWRPSWCKCFDIGSMNHLLHEWLLSSDLSSVARLTRLSPPLVLKHRNQHGWSNECLQHFQVYLLYRNTYFLHCHHYGPWCLCLELCWWIRSERERGKSQNFFVERWHSLAESLNYTLFVSKRVSPNDPAASVSRFSPVICMSLFTIQSCSCAH